MSIGMSNIASKVKSHDHADLGGVGTESSVQIINLDEFDAVQKGQLADASPILKNLNPIHAVKTRLQVFVGELEISVGELLSAKEHQVFTLKNSISEPIELVLEGQVVARGQLVAVDGHFAVKITDLPLPLSY